MKICFFTDIHGNGYSFRAFERSVQAKNVDKIIFGGDVFGYYYDAESILTALRKSGYICLLGNHDKMFLDLLNQKIDEKSLIRKYGNSYSNILSGISAENISFLRGLPKSYEMTTESGKKIGFFHGGPADPLEMRIYPNTVISDTSAFDKYDYVFCGHTHHKLKKRVGRCIIINPGSAGQQRDGKGTSYCIFDTETEGVSIESFSYDRNALIRDIKERETDENMKEKLIEVLFRGEKQ